LEFKGLDSKNLLSHSFDEAALERELEQLVIEGARPPALPGD
jgi:hypothetical protein